MVDDDDDTEAIHQLQLCGLQLETIVTAVWKAEGKRTDIRTPDTLRYSCRKGGKPSIVSSVWYVAVCCHFFSFSKGPPSLCASNINVLKSALDGFACEGWSVEKVNDGESLQPLAFRIVDQPYTRAITDDYSRCARVVIDHRILLTYLETKGIKWLLL